jgi:hypothetical protein
MFDSNADEPSFDIGGYGEDDYSDGGKSKGKMIGLAIIAIVVIAALFVGMTYLGGQQKIQFSISELDGGPVTARLIVKDSAGTEIIDERTSNTEETFSRGTYNYSVNSPGYKLATGSITVPDSPETIPITLVKDVSGSMNATLSNTKIYEGSEINGTLTISNTGNTLIDMIAIDSSSSGLFDIVFTPAVVKINPGAATGIDFVVTVKKDISAPQDEEITFKLRGTNVSTKTDLLANPAVPKSKVNIGKTSITDNALKANQRKTLSLKVDNDDRQVGLENVTVEIVPNPGLEFEERLDWFEFGLYTGEKYKRVIDSVPKNSAEPMQLHIDVPVDAQEGEIFSGFLRVSSPSMEAPLEINMTLTVKEGVSYNLELNNKLTYSTTCNFDSCETIRTLEKGLELKNTGKNQAVENIALSINDDSDPMCHVAMDIINDSIDKIEPSDEVELNIIIDAEYEEEKNYCILDITYDDPITGIRTIKQSQSIEITLNYRE